MILGGSRLVIHIQTSLGAIEDFLSLLGLLAEEKKRSGAILSQEELLITSATKIYVRPKKPLVDSNN